MKFLLVVMTPIFVLSFVYSILWWRSVKQRAEALDVFYKGMMEIKMGFQEEIDEIVLDKKVVTIDDMKDLVDRAKVFNQAVEECVSDEKERRKYVLFLNGLQSRISAIENIRPQKK